MERVFTVTLLATALLAHGPLPWAEAASKYSDRRPPAVTAGSEAGSHRGRVHRSQAARSRQDRSSRRLKRGAPR
jgi:hypothetical protein